MKHKNSVVVKFILLFCIAIPRAGFGQNSQYFNVLSGTGFYVNKEYIVTNQHVVKGCNKVIIKDTDNEHEGVVKIADTAHDLAIIETDSPPNEIAPLRFNIDALHAGDRVYVAGYPGEAGLRGEYKIVQGKVEEIPYNIAGENPERFYISDVLEHGNSGGPVLDNSGNVIGVVVASTKPATINNIAQDKVAEKSLGVVISLGTLKRFLDDNRIYFRWTESGLLLFTDNYIEKRARNYLVNVQCRILSDKPYPP